MSIFGICFILYFHKLSACRGFLYVELKPNTVKTDKVKLRVDQYYPITLTVAGTVSNCRPP